MKLVFKPIDIDQHFETCKAFRKDSYFINFNSYKGIEAATENYKKRIQESTSSFPQGNCHIWHNNKIVGQIEMNNIDNDDIGYINLFYLVESYRGKKQGRKLNDYAIDIFTKKKKKEIQLSVSRSNPNALHFYEKNGWKNLGPKKGKEMMLLMSYKLT